MNSNLFSAMLSGLAVYFFVLTLVALGLDFAVAKYAQSRGLSFKKYFWMAFLLSPLVAMIVVLVKATKSSTRFESTTGSIFSGSDGELGKCPMCAELIKIEAKVCRHCGASVEEHFNQIILAREVQREAAEAQREAVRQAAIDAASARAMARKAFWQKRSTRLSLVIIPLALLVAGITSITVIAYVEQTKAAAMQEAKKNALSILSKCVDDQGRDFATKVSSMGYAYALDASQFILVEPPNDSLKHKVQISISFNLPSEANPDDRSLNAAQCSVSEITGKTFLSTLFYGASYENYGRGYSFDFLLREDYPTTKAYILMTKGF